MGCLGCDYYYQDIINHDRKATEIIIAFSKSKDDMLRKFTYHYSKKNYEILKKIYEENDIVSERLKQKIKEYVKKREESKPLVIATGKCGNPCYAYQQKIIFNCPKCDGNVNDGEENDYETEEIYDTRNQRFKPIKKYLQKNTCTRFNFNENVDKYDVSVDDLIKYFEKVDDKKIVHWSCDTKNSLDIFDRNVIPVEKDMPIHYMMLDGERFDFPYGIHMRDFLMLNHDKFFSPDNLPSKDFFTVNYLKDEQFFRSKKIPSPGEYCKMFYRDEDLLGKSLGHIEHDSSVYVVYIYECDDCHHKYHIIRTSPFHFRDKSKDQ